MTQRIVAYREPCHTGDDWEDLPSPLDEEQFSEFLSRQDEGSEEGLYAEGDVRLEDGSQRSFRITKHVSVDFILRIGTC